MLGFNVKIIKANCKARNKKQLVAVAGCSDDLAAVSALPETWTPRKGSSFLTNYLKQRENDYKKVLNIITEDARIVNDDIDMKVQNIAEILLSDIRKNQNDILCFIETQQTTYPLSKEDRDSSLKRIAKLAMERIQDLLKFKQEALALERQRADGLRKTLKSQFQSLMNVGHKPPKDLLHDFDEQIYDINQQLLSNSRAYIELEAQLRLQLDENLVHARSRLNQLCLNDSKVIKYVNSPSGLSERLTSREAFRNTGFVNSTPLNNIECKEKSNAQLLNERLSNDLDMYKATCDKILKVFLGLLDHFTKKYTGNELCESRNELSDLNKIVGLDLCNNIKCIEPDLKNEKKCKFINNDLLNMRMQLSSLIKHLHDMYFTLSNTFDLCNKYLNRWYLGQTLIKASLGDLQMIHDSYELSNEVNYNIGLEQMRNASDIDKLQQQFDFLTNNLTKISETYYQQKDIEIAKVEDFVHLSSIMAHVVLSEIACFQINNTKDSTHAKSQNTSTVLELTKEILSLRAPLLEAALQTELQCQEIIEYKNVYLDSLDFNLNSIPDCLIQKTRQWIDDETELLNMRYSLKRLSHSIRAERLKTVYEIRYSELRLHEAIITSHLDAMYNLIDKMPLEASEYLAIDAPELYPFCKWINSIKIDIERLCAQDQFEPEFIWLKMNSYSHRLIKHRRQFEESLLSAIEEHKRDLEYIVQRARISNVNLLSQMKLLFEGGRYASTEATKSCMALVKAGDALESAFTRTLDVLQHRRSQLLSLADQQILPIQRIVEENLKHGAKNVFDKKVMPSTKKK